MIQINDDHEGIFKTITARSTETTYEQPTTQMDIPKNSVSIFPNGFDFSTTETSAARDSFENEISLDDLKDVKTFKTPATIETTSKSTTKVATRVTSSISLSSSTTSKIPSSTTISMTEKTTERPTTTILSTTEKIIETTPSTTTENFIEKNYKILQQLLGQTSSKAPKITTTEMPPSTTFLITTTKTEEIPSTTFQTSTQRKIPTQISTQATRHTEIISSTKPIRQTTISSSLMPSSTTSTVKENPTTSSSELITTLSSSTIPKTSTHRFSPIRIPSDPPTMQTTVMPKTKAPFSDTEDVDFLVTVVIYDLDF